MDPASIAAISAAVISTGKTLYDIYDDVSNRELQRSRELQAMELNHAAYEAKREEAIARTRAEQLQNMLTCGQTALNMVSNVPISASRAYTDLGRFRVQQQHAKGVRILIHQPLSVRLYLCHCFQINELDLIDRRIKILRNLLELQKELDKGKSAKSAQPVKSQQHKPARQKSKKKSLFKRLFSCGCVQVD